MDIDPRYKGRKPLILSVAVTDMQWYAVITWIPGSLFEGENMPKRRRSSLQLL